jgi:hypothetical protein
MGEVRSSLDDIASAADEGDPEAAREATLQLIDRSEELRDARQALASAVREDEWRGRSPQSHLRIRPGEGSRRARPQPATAR